MAGERVFSVHAMEIEDGDSLYKSNEKIFRTFSNFMLRITKFDELVEVGSKLLIGFQQRLEYLQHQPIEKSSELIKCIIRDNESKRLSSYIEAGCLNAHDSVQNMSKSKCVVDELACLLKDAEAVVQSINYGLAQMEEQNVDNVTDSLETSHDEAVATSVDPREHEITNIAIMMAVVYSMVKSDYTMQEKIVYSLKLTSRTGELESYSSMWSLRPYIDDEIMHKAWKLVR